MAETDPLVSVVIPTYNNARYLKAALDSVLEQDYSNIEIIVVDDGSTDETKTVLEPYLSEITYVYQENSGVSSARNLGIDRASGEWIALLDADDTWHPRKTSVQIEFAKKIPSVPLIGLTQNTGKMDDELNTDEIGIDYLNVHDFLISAPFGVSSLLIRKEALDQVGAFDSTLHGAEDRELYLRISSKFPVARINCKLWRYRLHDGQSSLAAKMMHKNFVRALRKYFSQHPDYSHMKSESLAYVHLDSAMSFFDTGSRFRALFHLGVTAFYAPFRTMRKTPFIRSKLFIKFLTRQPN